MISKAFAAYQTNIEIQKLEKKVETESSRVDDLEKEADMLKEPDRIMDIARKKGLKLGDKKSERHTGMMHNAEKKINS